MNLTPAQPAVRKPARPRSVTLLALGVLSISSLNLLRLWLAFRQWQDLANLPGVSPLYLALTGGIWALVGFPLAWGLWRGQRLAPARVQGAAWVYALYFWLERLFLFDRPLEQSLAQALRPQWPVTGWFSLALMALMLIILYGALARPQARRFFAGSVDV